MKKVLLLITLSIFICSHTMAQINISGKVTDSNGETIPGANVSIKGTAIGTVTDIKGEYVLGNVPADATLLFSFLGMLPEEISVQGRTTINVSLIDDIQSLDEVVVVGYGTVKRANLAGAVTDISAEKLKDIPVVNLTAALEGRLSGVRVSLASGKPGVATKFQIRETTSNKVGELPLFVIDGIVRDQSSFDVLDPSEVESISVLKDASAAVYGASAAGGVVLVTTKKGKAGKPRINYTSSYGITDAINTTEMLSAYDHAVMYNDGLIVQGEKDKTAYFSEDELAYFKDSLPNGGYDWLGGLWKSSTLQRHSLNYSGGSETTRYYVGGTYLHETGNLEDLYIKKYTVRSSVETELTSRLTAAIEFSANFKNNRTPKNPTNEQGDIMDETFKALLQNPKFVPPVIDGKFVKQGLLINNNPYATFAFNNYSKGESNSFSITPSMSYKIPYVEGLTAKFQTSMTKGSSYDHTYKIQPFGYIFETSGNNGHIIKPDAELVPDTVGSGNIILFDGSNEFSESMGKSFSYQTNLSLSYSRSLGKHDIGALMVCEFSESNSSQVKWTRSGSQLVDGYDYEWAFDIDDDIGDPDRNDKGDLGYIGRVNYNYNSRYIGEFAFRYQASSNFSRKYRWGFFPSFLVGWIVSEENFFSSVLPVMNFLKFRGSYGIVGNDNLGNLQYLLRYKINQENLVLFGDQLVNTLNIENGGIVNDQLKWQNTRSYNAGADMRFWSDRINYSLDVFYNLTDNMLEQMGPLMPTVSGIARNNKVVFNYGKAHSYGYEMELGFNGRARFGIEYGINGNFSWAEFMKLKVAQATSAEGTWHDELKNAPDNQPGYISTGIIRDMDEVSSIMMDNPNYAIGSEAIEPGMLNYKDIRGSNYEEGPNGTFSGSMDEDRTIIAERTTPPYIYGTNLFLKWKGFAVDMTFSGKFGHYEFFDKEATELPEADVNVPAFWKDHWTPDNTDAAYPRAGEYPGEGENSTFWMRNGHTLRLTDFSVSYAMPNQISRFIGISNFRIFFNTKYLWTIIQPFEYKDANLAHYNGYPMTRTYNFGINISL